MDPQHSNNFWRERIVAWSELDVCHLGPTERGLPYSRSVYETRARQNTGRRRAERDEHSEEVSDDFEHICARLHGLGGV